MVGAFDEIRVGLRAGAGERRLDGLDHPREARGRVAQAGGDGDGGAGAAVSVADGLAIACVVAGRGDADDARTDGDRAARTGGARADACAVASADGRDRAAGDDDAVAAAADAGALGPAVGVDRPAVDGDGVAAADAGAMAAAVCGDRPAVDGDVAVAAADAVGPVAAVCGNRPAVDDDAAEPVVVGAADAGPAVVVRHIAAAPGDDRAAPDDDSVARGGDATAAADAGRHARARGADRPALDHDGAAAGVGERADAGGVVAGRFERAVAADGERLAGRDEESRIARVGPLEEVRPLQDDRGVAEAGEARPRGAVGGGSVDRRVEERHRRAVGDGDLVGAAERSRRDLAVDEHPVPAELREVDDHHREDARRAVGRVGAAGGQGDGADDGRAVAVGGRRERAVAPDGERPPLRDVDAGVVAKEARDGARALEDDRGVAEAGEARPRAGRVVRAGDGGAA